MSGVFRLVDTEFTGVDLGLGKPITTHGPHYSDGVLLSVSSHDICLFDGGRWTEVIHP